MHDLASWLEAWNIFLAVRVQSHPWGGSSIGKVPDHYMPSVFSILSISLPKYDSLFRQAAARDKFKLIAWDHPKKDILVWCATRQPFRSTKFQLGQTGTGGTGPSSTPSGRSTHTSTGQEICRKFNFDRCIKGSQCSFARKCWIAGCRGDYSAKSCTQGPSTPG